MPETESRSARVRGRSAPDCPDWTVSTGCRLGTNRNGMRPVPIIGSDVALDESHFYVTMRKATPLPVRPNEYDHFVVANGAFGELEE